MALPINFQLKNNFFNLLDNRINSLLLNINKEDMFAERIYILLSKHSEIINDKSAEEKEYLNKILKYVLTNSDIYRKNIIENVYSEISNTVNCSSKAVEEFSIDEIMKIPFFEEKKNFIFSSFAKENNNSTKEDFVEDQNRKDKEIIIENNVYESKTGIKDNSNDFNNITIDFIRKSLKTNEQQRFSLSTPLPTTNELFSLNELNDDEENLSNSDKNQSNLLSCISKVSSIKLNKKPFSQKEFISNLKSPSPVSQKITTKKILVKSVNKRNLFGEEK